ncbi:MAG: patatin-like phospholipase family protein [Nitrososphaeraceae archaeon]
MSVNENVPKVQRALVLQGGGALGAYEAGVLNILTRNLRMEDKENGEKNRLLFDVIAGTSIGAMNGAILVSQYLETKSWDKASEELEKFWTDQLSIKSLDIGELNKPWYDEWVKKNPTAASEEAARRYYSVKKLLLNQVQNNMYYRLEYIKDDRFFDTLHVHTQDPSSCFNNDWLLHSNKPLRESIEKYARFPILTDFKNKQPRLLVCSVDVAEGVTVTFDSYPKADGSRKSEYGNYNNESGYENVIDYSDGITINHIMASGTLPEFYNHAEVSIHTSDKQKTHLRYFWDGGLLSSTPVRELLHAHQEYWKDVENINEIPELDVYIVNVHPSKIDIGGIPTDHNGVKDRQNDITYADRNSRYDENITRLIGDYASFVTEMKDLLQEAICKVNDENDKDVLKRKLNDILVTKTSNKGRKYEARNYEDLIRGRFKLNKVIRIERTNYINSIYGKTGDLTFETIHKLIKEGECDAWFSLIQQLIEDIRASTDAVHIRDSLLNKWNQVIKTLRDNDYDYGANNSHIHRELTKFIGQIKKNKEIIDGLKTNQSTKLMDLTDRFRASLD